MKLVQLQRRDTGLMLASLSIGTAEDTVTLTYEKGRRTLSFGGIGITFGEEITPIVDDVHISYFSIADDKGGIKVTSDIVSRIVEDIRNHGPISQSIVCQIACDGPIGRALRARRW